MENKGISNTLQDFLETWHLFICKANYKVDTWYYVFYLDIDQGQLPMQLDLSFLFVQGNTDKEIVIDLLRAITEYDLATEIELQYDKYEEVLGKLERGDIKSGDVLYDDAVWLRDEITKGEVILIIVRALSKLKGYMEKQLSDCLSAYLHEV